MVNSSGIEREKTLASAAERADQDPGAGERPGRAPRRPAAWLRAVPAVGLAAAVLIGPRSAAVPPPAAAPPAQVVDCIAADVAGQPITRVDVLLAERLDLFERPEGAAAEDETARRRRILDGLIGQALVLSLARQQLRVEDAEIDAAAAALEKRLGPEAVAAAASDFGLAGEDLRNVLRDGLLRDKIVAMRFSQPPAVSLKEIETYYEESYVPAVRALKGTPEPLIVMLDLIEARLRQAKRSEQVDAWLRDLRTQADVKIRPDCLR